MYDIFSLFTSSYMIKIAVQKALDSHSISFHEDSSFPKRNKRAAAKARAGTGKVNVEGRHRDSKQRTTVVHLLYLHNTDLITKSR